MPVRGEVVNDGPMSSHRQYHSMVVLCPVYDDLECEVTIDGYSDWLPQGNIDDTEKPGSVNVTE